jgi:hypothetical protein
MRWLAALIVLFLCVMSCPRDNVEPRKDIQNAVEPEDEFNEPYKVYPMNDDFMRQTLKEVKEELTPIDGGTKK